MQLDTGVVHMNIETTLFHLKFKVIYTLKMMAVNDVGDEDVVC